MKVINITSSMQNEGKTTVISNLAVNFANLEKKVFILKYKENKINSSEKRIKSLEDKIDKLMKK